MFITVHIEVPSHIYKAAHMASVSFFSRIKLSIVTPLKTSLSEVASSRHPLSDTPSPPCLPTLVLPGSLTVNQPTRPIVLSSIAHPLSGASPSGLPGLGRNKYDNQGCKRFHDIRDMT
jgi:hypothetical protein